MKIVVVDGMAVNPGDLSWECLKKFGEVTVYDHNDVSLLRGRISEAEVVVTNKVVMDAERMDWCPNLKLIAVTATGYNMVDCRAARERGITVTNIPAYSSDSVAQMVFAFLLNVTNRVQHYSDENRGGRWTKALDFCYTDFSHHELAGQTFGIVGMGNIGMRVAMIANAFGMGVVAATHRQQSDLPEYIRKVTVNELFGVADIISLHCPLTVENRGFINAGAIEKMKRGVILINTGRGPLINDNDVAEGLKTGQIGAFCADVLTKEPPTEGNPLLDSPNSFITPHIAWATFEARKRLMDILICNIRAFAEGKPINVV